MSVQSYKRELDVAALAVQRAALATKLILGSMDKGAISKSDDSPVTVADFAAQALLISAIHNVFPDDTFVGEESSTALRENQSLLERVWALVHSIRLEDAESETILGHIKSPAEMLDVIDLGGNGLGGGTGRVWMLDPVDGTATFMRGEQYAVCLGLVEDGDQKVGVLGLPNLKPGSEAISENVVDSQGHGIMLSAVRGQGAYSRVMSSGGLADAQAIQIRTNVTNPDKIHAINQRGDTMDVSRHRLVAEKLGADWPGTELWAAQVRYSALAIGGGDFLVRIPLKPGKRVNTWDHIGGILIVEESGGKVTDLNGKAIDFGTGRKLSANFGIVAARADIHAMVLKVVGEVIGDSASTDV
ncbi:3',5'-bisphosphate nucleotidase-1 [Coleophoma cylindrospora]|uniref:3'(2'),5'-bisphosphate nucleotidase n=1 Tax=Coleophoma cylindrospora TaxID=1849047 RepID=A0A3D8S2F6_9HELO|nr:3',5'-bisphosphate nucleotidase-1 [Coleophoma cylindrospora]